MKQRSKVKLPDDAHTMDSEMAVGGGTERTNKLDPQVELERVKTAARAAIAATSHSISAARVHGAASLDSSAASAVAWRSACARGRGGG